MRSRLPVVLYALLLGLLAWCIDALIDYNFLYADRSFSDMLLHPPEPEFYARLVVVGMFLAFGLVVARVLERHALAEARANALNRILRATEAVQQIVARQRDRRRLLAEACR